MFPILPPSLWPRPDPCNWQCPLTMDEWIAPPLNTVLTHVVLVSEMTASQNEALLRVRHSGAVPVSSVPSPSFPLLFPLSASVQSGLNGLFHVSPSVWSLFWSLSHLPNQLGLSFKPPCCSESPCPSSLVLNSVVSGLPHWTISALKAGAFSSISQWPLQPRAQHSSWAQPLGNVVAVPALRTLCSKQLVSGFPSTLLRTLSTAQASTYSSCCPDWSFLS